MSRQISERILEPNGGYRVYYPSNLKREVLKIGEYHSDIPHFKLGHIQSSYTFRPIAHARKYLVDYN